MRIAIAEDCPNDGKQLISDISRWAAEHNIPLVPAPALYKSGEDLLQYFSKEKYDIIFLDIYMEGLNGMETARLIRSYGCSCHLIFTTSTAEFAVDSYDVRSTWYLVKPYSYEKLSSALARCEADLIEQRQCLYIPGKIENQKLLLHEIVWTEYVNRHICIHLNQEKEVCIRMRQGEFAKFLLTYPYFCDCMKGILVNLEYIAEIKPDCCLLQNGQSLPVSRLKYHDVLEKYRDFCFADIRKRTGCQKPIQPQIKLPV